VYNPEGDNLNTEKGYGCCASWWWEKRIIKTDETDTSLVLILTPWFNKCLYCCLKYVLLYTGHTGLTVALIYILEVLCFIQKLKGNWKLIFHINGYSTRGKTDLHTQTCNTALFKKSVVNVWSCTTGCLGGGAIEWFLKF